ncbi:MAG: pyridoxamine 5'-phosphate oxidase [Pseudomonadota bacterium]
MTASLSDETVAAGQAPDPFALFDAWLIEAKAREINDANAMAVATVDESGMPDVRTLLLKGHDAAGFVFYTNTQSRKGDQLRASAKAALLFHWKSLRRQVRVRGPITPVSPEEADAYFATRPRLSQIGAWASDQSRPAKDRAELQTRVDARLTEYPDTVPRPPHWSGYRLAPITMEFWQDGANRLHDRFVYTFGTGGYTVQRLFP